MRLLFGLYAAALWAQSPAAPTALAVKSATSRQVQLAWTAADGAKSYLIQRKSDTAFTSLATVTSAAATDSSIDPYTTYVYRVVAVNDAGQSGPSNEVTVGPPPYGFNVVVPGPKPDTATRTGVGVRLILDGNGDPMLAWILADPDGDGDGADSELWFLSWNRALYKWNDAVRIARIGTFDTTGAQVPLSLARDASTGLLGIAFQHEDADHAWIDLALSSDGGATWKIQNVSKLDSPTLAAPKLGLDSGSGFLAWSNYDQGLRYLSGKSADEIAKWKAQAVPMPGGYARSLELLSLAVDSAGNPGLAYLVGNDHNTAAAFWRPEAAGSAVIAADNNGHDDCSDISLSFSGAEPRIAFAGMRDDYDPSYDHAIWAIRSSNDGGAWLPAVSVPSDGKHDLKGPIASASGPHGQLVIAITDAGGIVDTAKYGAPKLARSDDLLSFQTTGPAPVDNPAYGNVSYPTVQYGGNDRIWVAFVHADYETTQLAPGIVLWRER